MSKREQMMAEPHIMTITELIIDEPGWCRINVQGKTDKFTETCRVAALQ